MGDKTETKKKDDDEKKEEKKEEKKSDSSFSPGTTKVKELNSEPHAIEKGFVIPKNKEEEGALSTSVKDPYDYKSGSGKTLHKKVEETEDDKKKKEDDKDKKDEETKDAKKKVKED